MDDSQLREFDSRAVVNSIRQIVHALEVGSRAAQRAVGLSGAQLFILQTLENNGTMSVNDLAARTHTHQSSVSAVVARLAEAGLVRREPCPQDARRLDLNVTTSGRKLLQSGFITPQERLFAALANLAPARLSALRSILQEIVLLSGMDSGTPPMFFESSSPKHQKRKTTQAV